VGSGPVGGVLRGATPFPVLQFTSNQATRSMSYANLQRAANSAAASRSDIYDLADLYSWETVAREMVSRMSGDEAREFVSDFISLYAD